MNGDDVLRQGCGPEPDPGQEGRGDRLRIAGARACAEPEGQRRQRARSGCRPTSRSRAKAQAAGLEVGRRGGGVEVGRRHHGARARHDGREALQGRDRAEPGAGQDADVRARLQHPLRHDHGASRRRRRRWSRRSRRATACASCTSKAPARRRSSPSTRTPPARRKALALSYAQGHRRHARRRHRDDVRRGNRDRSLRRAGRALRRRERAHQGRVRDAGRGRLPAGDRVLRVPARAEADRRPDLPGRPELHALLGQRHGRARRLHRRPAPRHRRDEDGDEEDARRDPQRPVREGLDRGERDGPAMVRGAARAKSGRTRSRRSAPSCAR